jgi:hypothetical protein
MKSLMCPTAVSEKEIKKGGNVYKQCSRIKGMRVLSE